MSLSLITNCLINFRKKDDVISVLETLAEESIQKTGLFHSGPELFCHQIKPHPKLAITEDTYILSVV